MEKINKTKDNKPQTIVGKAKAQANDSKTVKIQANKDTSNPDLRKKMKDRIIQYYIARMEGSDPKKFSRKHQSKSMERVRHSIEKQLRKTENISFSDRRISTKMPKHLFCGKRGDGKTDRR